MGGVQSDRHEPQRNAATSHLAASRQTHDPSLPGTGHRVDEDNDAGQHHFYADLLYQANNIAQTTFRTIEVYTVAATMYFIVIFACSIAVRRLEKRLARSGETVVN